MSTRGDDQSRPSHPLTSPRPTTRDVPIAKFKELSVGTSPPRGLRGQSLQPGQGAPERIIPEEIELAVLRDAETLDGRQLVHASAGRIAELTGSPPPTPVSVEVPRVRSVRPDLEAYGTTPTTPSARSIQSGTLMSIGSVDPRAPTELSLPSPRKLSHSERAAYFGPEAVVDRTPASASPAAVPREGAALATSVELAELVDRQASPHSEPMPHSSARSMPAGSGPPVSSARRSQKPDSPAPYGRHFGRAPQSYSPLSAPLPSAPHSAPRAEEPPASDAPPEFEIHAQLDAVPHAHFEDNFDLRSVSTQREPLASRKPMESSDWTTVHEPISARRDSSVPSERTPSRAPSSSSAITILVDRGGRGDRAHANLRHSLPSAVPVSPARASVPVSWVLAAAGFALLLALIVAWVMRAPVNPEAARPALEHSQPEPLATAPLPRPAAPSAAKVATQSADPHSGPSAALGSAPKASPSPAASAIRMPESGLNSPLNARPAPSGSAHPSELPAHGASAPEAGPKARQSIY